MDLVGFTAEPSAPKDVRSEGDCCAVREWVCPALPLHLTLRPLCRVETTPAATFGRAEAADWGDCSLSRVRYLFISCYLPPITPPTQSTDATRPATVEMAGRSIRPDRGDAGHAESGAALAQGRTLSGTPRNPAFPSGYG